MTSVEEIKTKQLDDIRERTLIAIGISPDELARLWKLSVGKLEDQLDAKKVQYFAHEGSVCDQRVDDDGSLQQRAAIELNKMVTSLAGLNTRTQSAETKASVTLDFSGWNISPPDPKPVTVKVETE